jgi:hypothetical protein
MQKERGPAGLIQRGENAVVEESLQFFATGDTTDML